MKEIIAAVRQAIPDASSKASWCGASSMCCQRLSKTPDRISERARRERRSSGLCTEIKYPSDHVAVHESLHGPSRPIAALQFFGRYWGHSGHRDALGRQGSVANDPSATSAVARPAQCLNGQRMIL